MHGKLKHIARKFRSSILQKRCCRCQTSGSSVAASVVRQGERSPKEGKIESLAPNRHGIAAAVRAATSSRWDRIKRPMKVAVCKFASTVAAVSGSSIAHWEDQAAPLPGGPDPSGFRYFFTDLSLLGSLQGGMAQARIPAPGLSPLGAAILGCCWDHFAACSGGCRRMVPGLWLLAALLQAR